MRATPRALSDDGSLPATVEAWRLGRMAWRDPALLHQERNSPCHPRCGDVGAEKGALACAWVADAGSASSADTPRPPASVDQVLDPLARASHRGDDNTRELPDSALACPTVPEAGATHL